MLRRPQSQANPAIAKHRIELERARADALSVRLQYERTLVLSAFLNSVPMKTEKGGTAPAASEYVAIRGELDVLLALIDARRTKVVTDGKAATPPGPAAIDAKPMKLVKASDIKTSVETANWFYEAGKDADEYVLVLEDPK